MCLTKRGSLVVFRRFVFAPKLNILIDYHGKNVDMVQSLQNFVAGLAQLNNSKVTLKAICHKQGCVLRTASTGLRSICFSLRIMFFLLSRAE